jgi:hypothetical protein
MLSECRAGNLINPRAIRRASQHKSGQKGQSSSIRRFIRLPRNFAIWDHLSFRATLGFPQSGDVSQLGSIETNDLQAV